MIRNVDLDKHVPVKIILEVLDGYFPRGSHKSFEIEEGFGGHYLDVDNEEILNVDRAVEDMVEKAESAWR